MAIEDELLAIRLELKGVAQTVEGLQEVDKTQEGVGRSTRRAGDEAKVAEGKTLSLGTAYGKLKSHAKLALGFIGVAGAFALETAISNTEELAKTTAGLSRNLGINTNVASRWGAVAYARGLDSKSLSTAFASLSTKSVEAARKGGSLLTPFHQLGISQEELVRHGNDFQWILMRVGKALGEEEGGTKRNTAAKALLGKGYSTLLPLFAEGTEGLKEQLHWADEYGATLTGTTKSGIMEMVESQRELKVATLGVEVAMTKAAKPAIEAAEDQMKEFIKTVNDPNLTAEQKINRIEKQFEGLETDLLHTLEDMLPTIAEHAGKLGVEMAGAVWHGFHESSIAGKVVIGAYIFNLFGGGALVREGAKKAGGIVGSEFGVGIAFGAVGAIVAYELWSRLNRQQKLEIKHWAEESGADFANFFIHKLNESLNELNPFGNLGPFSIAAPQVPEVEGPGALVTEIPGGSPEIVKGHPHGHPRGGHHGTPQEVREAERALEAIEGERRRKRRQHVSQSFRMETPRLDLGAFRGGGGSGRPIHVHLHVDGRQIAESVVGTAEDEAALR